MKPMIFLAFANDKVDHTKYLRNLPAEHDGIREALQEAQKQDLCEVIERANLTAKQFVDVFQDSRYRDRIAVFHFGGHADGYQLLLEDLHQTLPNSIAHGSGLVSFLSKQQGLKLVFFNGCTSERQARELSEAGIPAVIGTVSEINDEIATDLAIRFYKGIGQGLDIERAWAEAQDAIYMQNGKDNLRGLYRKDLKYPMPNSLPWKLYCQDQKMLEWKLERLGNESNNMQIKMLNVTPNINMSLEAFKKYLISLIDDCKMDTFFNEVENCNYDYDKPIYNNQKRNYFQTNPLLNPCAMFGQQWKVFVGTLREKK